MKIRRAIFIIYFNMLQLRSALLTLKGQVYEALDNRNLATDCYKEALRNNVNCFEALNALLQHGLLTSLEGIRGFLKFYLS